MELKQIKRTLMVGLSLFGAMAWAGRAGGVRVIRRTNPFAACRNVPAAVLAPAALTARLLHIPEQLDSAQLTAAEALLAGVIEQRQTALTKERGHLHDLIDCLEPLHDEWAEDLPAACRALPDYQRYHEFVYQELPVTYRALRVTWALAFPPTAHGPAARLWDFTQQVNVNLEAPPSWPLVGRPEPLWQSADPATIDEVQLARDEFFRLWRGTIEDYLKHLEAFDHESGLAPELRASLSAPTPEEMAYRAGTLADRDWQAVLAHAFAEARAARINTMIALIDHVRVVTVLSAAVPRPSDLVRAFRQMLDASAQATRKANADRARLRTRPIDLDQWQHLGQKYLAQVRFVEAALRADPARCAAATQLWDNLSVAQTNEILDGVILLGTALYWAPPLVVAGALFGANVKWTREGEAQLRQSKLDLITTTSAEPSLVTAAEVYADGQQAERQYLNFPLLLFAEGFALRGVRTPRFYSALKTTYGRALALRPVAAESWGPSPFKMFRFVNR